MGVNSRPRPDDIGILNIVISTMDTEQQSQLKFLDEAEDCYERIERTLLGLATHVAEAEPLDEALRAAHTVKGGAAMMGAGRLK